MAPRRVERLVVRRCRSARRSGCRSSSPAGARPRAAADGAAAWRAASRPAAGGRARRDGRQPAAVARPARSGRATTPSARLLVVGASNQRARLVERRAPSPRTACPGGASARGARRPPRSSVASHARWKPPRPLHGDDRARPQQPRAASLRSASPSSGASVGVDAARAAGRTPGTRPARRGSGGPPGPRTRARHAAHIGKRPHRLVRSRSYGQRLDDREPRAAVGAVDERIAGSGGRRDRTAPRGRRRTWRRPAGPAGPPLAPSIARVDAKLANAVGRRAGAPADGVHDAASGGASRAIAVANASSASGAPSAWISPRRPRCGPSPSTPWRAASRHTNGRNPTPWTTPRTSTSRRLRVASGARIIGRAIRRRLSASDRLRRRAGSAARTAGDSAAARAATSPTSTPRNTTRGAGPPPRRARRSRRARGRARTARSAAPREAVAEVVDPHELARVGAPRRDRTASTTTAADAVRAGPAGAERARPRRPRRPADGSSARRSRPRQRVRRASSPASGLPQPITRTAATPPHTRATSSRRKCVAQRDARVVVAHDHLAQTRELRVGLVEHAGEELPEVLLHVPEVLRGGRHDLRLEDRAVVVHVVAVEQDAARRLGHPGRPARPAAGRRPWAGRGARTPRSGGAPPPARAPSRRPGRPSTRSGRARQHASSPSARAPLARHRRQPRLVQVRRGRAAARSTASPAGEDRSAARSSARRAARRVCPRTRRRVQRAALRRRHVPSFIGYSSGLHHRHHLGRAANDGVGERADASRRPPGSRASASSSRGSSARRSRGAAPSRTHPRAGRPGGSRGRRSSPAGRCRAA